MVIKMVTYTKDTMQLKFNTTPSTDNTPNYCLSGDFICIVISISKFFCTSYVFGLTNVISISNKKLGENNNKKFFVV